MAYHPEEVRCRLCRLLNFNSKPSKAPADWEVEMTYARYRQVVPLHRGAVTNALFCEAESACLRFPYSLNGKIHFVLLHNGQSRAHGSVRLDGLTGANKPVVSKTVPLEWESPADRMQGGGASPELVLDLCTLPEPPRNHPGSVWLTSFPASVETPAPKKNDLMFPDRGFSFSLWKNMLNDVNDSPMPMNVGPSTRPHPNTRKAVDLDEESPRYEAPGTPPNRHTRGEEERPFRPLAPFEPPGEVPDLYERPAYNPQHSNAHHQAPGTGHRPSRPSAGANTSTRPHETAYRPKVEQEDTSCYYSSLDHKPSGGSVREHQPGHLRAPKPLASPRDKTDSYSVTATPYRPYPAGSQPSLAPAVGWSGHVGAPAAQGEVVQNLGRHSGKGSPATKEKSSYRFRIFTGHKKSAPSDSELYAAATKNEVSAVASQDLIRNFARGKL